MSTTRQLYLKRTQDPLDIINELRVKGKCFFLYKISPMSLCIINLYIFVYHNNEMTQLFYVLYLTLKGYVSSAL